MNIFQFINNCSNTKEYNEKIEEITNPDTNIVFTDPKGEIFQHTIEILKEKFPNDEELDFNNQK